MRRFKSEISELTILNRTAELPSPLIYEAACARSTGLIHLIINNYSVALDDKLGILSAYFNYICIRFYLSSSPGLRRNLVFYHIGAKEAPHQISPRAGYTRTGYLRFVTDIMNNVAEHLLNSFNRPSCRHQIVLLHDFCAGLIEYDCFGAGGAHIHPKIACKWRFYFRRIPAITLGNSLQAGRFEIAQRGVGFLRYNHIRYLT